MAFASSFFSFDRFNLKEARQRWRKQTWDNLEILGLYSLCKSGAKLIRVSRSVTSIRDFEFKMFKETKIAIDFKVVENKS